jgi:uncharacterized protein
VRYVRVVNATRGSVLGGRIRIADDFRTRTFGLLGSRVLPPGEGLLLIPCRGIHMIGMRFPIDVAFLDRRGMVLAAHAGLAPGLRLRWQRQAMATIELPQGTLEASGTRRGDLLSWLPADGGQGAAASRAVDDEEPPPEPESGGGRSQAISSS